MTHTPGPTSISKPIGGGSCKIVTMVSRHPDFDIPTDGYIADFYSGTVGSQRTPEDRMVESARLASAAYTSYDKHFGPRAVEAAEADLLGEALAIVEAFEDVYRNGYPEGERAVEVANRARYLLSKSKGVGK